MVLLAASLQPAFLEGDKHFIKYFNNSTAAQGYRKCHNSGHE